MKTTDYNGGHEHDRGAWTCMWCGAINVFVWDDDQLVDPITMMCDECGGGTFMEKNEALKPDGRHQRR